MSDKIYQCQMASCGYMYIPAKGDKKNNIPKGTSFEDLPETYKCPLCGVNKKMFKAID